MTLAKKLLTGSGSNSKPYVEFVSSTPMTITPIYTNSGVTLEYSLNGSSWTTIATGTTTPSANIIYFRGQATGTKTLFISSPITNAWTFTGSTNLECNGKLDRLIQSSLGGDSDILTINDYCFAYMFRNIATLIKAPSLPATTLASNCYENMFRGCTSLTTAPSLPATTLASSCYESMFSGCTSLTTAPSLPATTLALQINCYYRMFRGCTSLTTAPSLPATTLASNCYGEMFSGCTNLTTLPKLPTLALQVSCYYRMFVNCTKIKLSTSPVGNYNSTYRIPITGTGTTANRAIEEMFYGTGGTFTGTPTINYTYWAENTLV